MPRRCSIPRGSARTASTTRPGTTRCASAWRAGGGSRRAVRERRGRVALIGYGRFGRALAELLAHAGHAVRAVDPFVAVPREHAAASLDDALRGARWVVLATPVAQLRPTLEAIRGRL